MLLFGLSTKRVILNQLRNKELYRFSTSIALILDEEVSQRGNPYPVTVKTTQIWKSIDDLASNSHPLELWTFIDYLFLISRTSGCDRFVYLPKQMAMSLIIYNDFVKKKKIVIDFHYFNVLNVCILLYIFLLV